MGSNPTRPTKIPSYTRPHTTMPSKKNRLEHSFRSFLTNHEQVSDAINSAPVVIAVSGGPDSTALAHVLARSNQANPATLVLAHLDHSIRSDSPSDVDHVRSLATSLGTRFEFASADIPFLAKAKRLNLEAAGRIARYEFLSNVANQYGASLILTGHSADDQLETFLMRFLRGSGTRGLSAMPASGPLPLQSPPPGILLARPLIYCRRSQIKEYISRHRLDPIIDPSNDDTDFLRNKLRATVIPALTSASESIYDKASATVDILRAEADLIDELTLQALHKTSTVQNGVRAFDQAPWSELPLALRRSTLRQAVSERIAPGTDISFASIEQARSVAEQGRVGSLSHLPGSVRLSCSYDSFTFTLKEDQPIKAQKLPRLQVGSPLELAVPGRALLDNGFVLAAGIPKTHESSSISVLVETTIPLPPGKHLTIRTRQPGDRFHPKGLDGHSQKVSDLMVDRKVPESTRELWPLVVDTSTDSIVWIPLLAKVHFVDSDGPTVNLQLLQRAI